MSKTKHPKVFNKGVDQSDRELLDSAHFTQGVNGDRNNMQASMTYMIDSVGSVPLGVGGETKGFAKGIEIPPKGGGRLIKGGAEDDNDCGLLTRQVASYRADRFLGLNVVAEEKFGRDANGKVIGISIQADGCNVLSNRGVFQVDCSDPKIQRGLSDLGVSDFISGQTDRHSGNIFIDPTTGRVTGIDNDLSFPEMALEKVSGQAVDRIVGMPRTMHAETRAKLLATDPEAFRKVLSMPPPNPGPSPMSKAAVDGAVDRLKKLQAELRKPDGQIQVVEKFDRQTYLAAIELQEKAFKKEVQVWVGSKTPPLGIHGYAKLTDAEKAALPPRLINSYDTASKTSYLGTVELEKAKNRVLTGNHILPEHNTTVPVNRVPQVAFEAKLAAAYGSMSRVEQKAFDKDLEKLNKLEAQLATKQEHLQHPGLADRFNALSKGMTAVMSQKQHNADMLSTDIQNLKAVLEQRADAKLQTLNTPTFDVSDYASESESQTPAKSTSKSLTDSSSNSLGSGEGNFDISADDALSEDIGQQSPGVTPNQSMVSPPTDTAPTQVPTLERKETVREMLEKKAVLQRAKSEPSLNQGEGQRHVRDTVKISEPRKRAESQGAKLKV